MSLPAGQNSFIASLQAGHRLVECFGHSVHAAKPVTFLNVLAKQAVGVLPSGPVYPAFATHAVAAVEPVAPPLAELAEQPVQSAFPVAAL